MVLLNFYNRGDSMKKSNKEKKVKKDIYIIIACLFVLIMILVAVAFDKKEEKKTNKPSDNSIQEVENREESNNRFPDYELNETNFREDTNSELSKLFDQEEINQNEIVKISNSLVKGYLYLLENRHNGTVYMKNLSAKDLGILSAEFLYTTQKKVCTDMSFLEELISLLFDDVNETLENDNEHFNEYNNSYCLDRETNKYKYHLSYHDFNYTKDYVTINYLKVLDNKNQGMLRVYFKSKDNRYYLEKIDL